MVEEGDGGPLALLLDAIDGVRATDGLLHLEVVGGPAEGADPANAVAEYLRQGGARHVVRGEVLGDDGRPGWRVTALVAAKSIAAFRRPLLAMGATRAVGLPSRFVFDRDDRSTFDRLRE